LNIVPVPLNCIQGHIEIYPSTKHPVEMICEWRNTV
jgi:hypothetical protein